jgi:ribosomal protein L40E
MSLPDGVLCPSCGAANDEGQGYCAECGYDLLRECLDCGAENSYSATHCQACGRSLSSLETMVERLQQGTAGRLEQQMGQAREIKELEEAASQRRQEELWRREYERQQRVDEDRAEREQQETNVIRLVFIGVIVVILLLIALAIFWGASGGDAAPSGWQILWSAYA